MNNLTGNKNIVYKSNITAGGNVHIGDVIYLVEDDFREAILFLEILKSDQNNVYTAQLSIKSPHTQKAQLKNTGVPLLEESVQLDIPAELFQQVTHFQQTRRDTDGYFKNIKRQRAKLPQTEESILANALYKHFFKAEIGKVVADFIELSQQSKIHELLLVIASDDATIRQLPWEMVIVNCFQAVGQNRKHLANDRFGLVRSRQVSLAAFNVAHRKAVAAPLKLLFVTALPENLSERGKMLEIEDEQRKLIEAIGEYEATGNKRSQIVIEFLDTASLEEIDAALHKRKHDIVHISGHGSFHQEVQQGWLYLENDDGDEEKVTGEQLAEVLRHHKCIQLLMLSACETATAGEKDTTEQLVASGIPTIIGMRFSVTDQGAKQFTNTFYGALAKGRSMTQALATARETLWQTVEQSRKNTPHLFSMAEWFTPVVYQNQYVSTLIQADAYNDQTYRQFYPPIPFRKTKTTRLIGQGFVGRKSYRIRLRKALAQHQHACLHGLGGLGKTTLAEAFANNYRHRYGHDILVFRGEKDLNEATILKKLLAKYKNTKPEPFLYQEVEEVVKGDAPIQEKLDELIANYLDGRKTIIIFDNAEDVQNLTTPHAFSSPALRDFMAYLLDNAPKDCHFIFTTRYRLSDLEDHVHHLNLDKMSYAEQYRYMNLSDTLRRIPQEERGDIYRRINGHPRAMEYLETLIKHQVLSANSSLDQELDTAAEQVFENLLLEKIYQHLPDAARQLFDQAGILISRSPLAALAAMTEQTEADLLPILKILQDWSLVFLEKETVEVHALTREWLAKEAHPPTPERQQLAYTTAQYFQNQPTWSDELLAKAYYEIAETWEEYAEATFNVQGHYQMIGLYRQAFELNQEVLAKNISPKINGQANNYLGLIGLNVGDYETALNYLQQSLIITQQIGDRPGEGTTLNNISQIYDARGDYETALNYLQQSLIISQQIGDRKVEGTILNNISQIFKATGDYETALNYLQQSLKISQEIGDRSGEGATLNNISQIYDARGDYETALNYLQQSLKISQEIGDRSGEGTTLNNISQIFKARGDYETALSYLQQSLKISQEIGDRSGEGATLNNISQIFKARGDYETALSYLQQSLKISQEIGDRSGEGATLNNISQIYDARGDYETALNYLQQSLKISQSIGDINGMAVSLTNMGAMLYEQEQFKAATPLLVQAYQIFHQIGSPNLKAAEGYLDAIIEKVGETQFQAWMAETQEYQ